MIATALSLSFLLGVSGLAIDIGRMYITKNEAQAYVDSASLAAARYLDGTQAGLTLASASTGSDTNKWRFDNSAFASVTTKFSTTSTGTFTATPPNPPTGYKYVQVIATANLPMYLIRVLTGPTALIAAAGVAGPTAVTTLPSGVFPFSPYTRIASPTNGAGSDPYGYKIGEPYTLRWGAPGNKTSCGDEDKHNIAQNGQIRGYCCVSNSAASLRQSIVSGDTNSETVGQSVDMDNGAKDTEMTAIADRANLDTDPDSGSYSEYRSHGNGNGARVIVVPVNGGAPNYVNLGFAGFFLLKADDYSGLKGNDSACAEYIGAWTQGEKAPSPGGSGAYKLRLFQ